MREMLISVWIPKGAALIRGNMVTNTVFKPVIAFTFINERLIYFIVTNKKRI